MKRCLLGFFWASLLGLPILNAPVLAGPFLCESLVAEMPSKAALTLVPEAFAELLSAARELGIQLDLEDAKRDPLAIFSSGGSQSDGLADALQFLRSIIDSLDLKTQRQIHSALARRLKEHAALSEANRDQAESDRSTVRDASSPLQLRRAVDTEGLNNAFEPGSIRFFFLPRNGDGKRAAWRTEAGAVHLIDPTQGRTIQTLELPSDPYVTIQFSEDGSKLLLGSQNGRVEIRDLATGNLLQKFASLLGKVTSIHLSSSGQLAASFKLPFMGPTLSVGWDLNQRPARPRRFSIPGQVIARHAESGKYLLNKDSALQIVDFPHGNGNAPAQEIVGVRMQRLFDRDRAIFHGYEVAEGRLSVMSLSGSGELRALYRPEGTVNSADATRINTTELGLVRIYESSSGDLLFERDLYSPQVSTARFFAMSPDGRVLAVGHSTGKVDLWDT